MIQQEQHTILMPSLQPANDCFQITSDCLLTQENLNQKYRELAETLQSCFTRWTKDDNFAFELPKSEFDHKRQTPIIRYLDPKAIVDDIQVQPFTASQKQSITKQGTFIVNSKRYSIPYQWQINPTIYKGRQKRWKEFISTLSSSWKQIYLIYKRCTEDKYTLGIKKTLQQYWRLTKRLVNLIIGVKSVRYYDQYQPFVIMEAMKQFDLHRKYGKQIDLDIYNYVTLEHQQTNDPQKNIIQQANYEKIMSIQNKWNTEWALVEQDWVDELSLYYSGEQYQEKLLEKKYAVLFQIKADDIPPNVLKDVHFLLEQARKIQVYKKKLIKTNKQIQQKISAEIRKNNPIKSLCYEWFVQQLNTLKAPLIKANQQLLLQQLSKQMHIVFFKDYLEFLKNWQQNAVKVRRVTSREQSMKHIYQLYTLFPPYEVQQSGYSYTFVTQYNRVFDVKNHFWLLKVYFYRVYYHARQMFYQLVHYALTGTFGLRSLFGTSVFYSQVAVNFHTGQVGWSQHSSKIPVILSIKKAVQRINQQRNKFQNAPDNGILKKSYLRIFNLINQYIIYGLLYTVLGLCIIKPLFCLFMISLTTTLAILSFPIAVVITFIRYLWNIVLVNLQTYYSPKSIDYLPIITIPLAYVFTTLRLVMFVIFISILHPALSVIIALFGAIYFLVSTVYNQFILILIKVIGRSPVGQSSVAWKIDGPGISKNYVQQINPDDIYILFQSECEKIQYQILRQEITMKLTEPLNEANTKLGPFYKIFKTGIPPLTKIQQSITYYHNKLNNQINQRILHYPRIDSLVRFTQQQLNQYTGNCAQLVKTFTQTRSHSDLYKYFSIKNRKPEKVVIKVWERIFKNRDVFLAYSGQQRFRMLDDVRAESEIRGFIGKQEGFRKKGHKKWNYNRSVQFDEYKAPAVFYPLQELINSLRIYAGYYLKNSKQDISCSIFVNPYLDSMKRRFGHHLEKLQ